MYASFEKLALTGLVFIVSAIVGAAAFTYFSPSESDREWTRKHSSWKQANEKRQKDLQKKLNRDHKKNMDRINRFNPTFRSPGNSRRRNGGSGKIGRIR